MRLRVSMLAWALLGSAAASAGAAPALEVGARVRGGIVREIPGRDAPIRQVVKRTGLFSALDSTGLRLTGLNGGPSLTVPLADVEELFVSRGRDPGRGLLAGLAWGSLAGFAATVVVDAIGNESIAASDRMEGGVYFAVVGASALLGGAAGAMRGAEVWEEYPVRRLWQQASAAEPSSP